MTEKPFSLHEPLVLPKRPNEVRKALLAMLWCIGTVAAPASMPPVEDSDILWSNSSSGERALWLMDGTRPTTWINLPTLSPDWRIAATGDFNGDGWCDLLLENTASGDRGIWIMNGTAPTAWINLPTIPIEWRIAATGDFNGDGQADILWDNPRSGDRGIWIMSQSLPVAWINLPTIPIDWRIAGCADFNGDGQSDIVWENASSGDHGIWLMNGWQPTAWINLPAMGAGHWRIIGVGDFNRDRKPDIVWVNLDTGERGVWLMDGTNVLSFVSFGAFPLEWAFVGVGDFNPPSAASDSEAARFLLQASFGPSSLSLTQVRQLTYAAWIDQQIASPATFHHPYFTQRVAEFEARDGSDGWWAPRQEAWWQNALTAPDQLRQRMAFALSQILVISQDSKLDGENEGVTAYYDLLVREAFGNYRQLLEDVTLSPMMGTYLSMIRNRKPNAKTGTQPDENYAREIMQLFSIGLSRLNPDGTLMLDGAGQPIPTYTQTDIVGLAHVFTGWGPHFDPANPPHWDDGTLADSNSWFQYGWDPLQPMSYNAKFGDQLARQIVAGTIVPASTSGALRLKVALDALFNHPNVGPFLARRLIQNFVTSNPSPAYIERVAAIFANNGSGVRGDLGATVKAVLLDPEARSAPSPASQTDGKLTEPLLRLTRLFRAFPPSNPPHANVGDNRYFINFVWDMDEEAPLLSPTVFNFFKPDYAQPGALAAAGLSSPEFQIYNDTTAIAEANRYFSSINWGTWVNEPADGTQLKLDLSEPLRILAGPGQTHAQAQAALVAYLNTRLFGGNMSPFLQQEILGAFAKLPAWFDYSVAHETSRIQLALYLVMISPECNIQR